MRRVAASAAIACAAALAAAPVAPAATIEVPERCYAEGDRIPVEGTGFTPTRNVRLALEKANGEVLASTDEPVAGTDGRVAGDYGLEEETGWFGRTQSRFELTVRLTDLANTANEASTSVVFSRWNVGITTRGGKIRPRRRARLRAVGFTNARGKPLFAHWFRNGKRVHTRRLGLLQGPCGDLRAKLPRGFPFRPVRPGSYEVRFTPSRTNTTKSAIRHRAKRVRRRIP